MSKVAVRAGVMVCRGAAVMAAGMSPVCLGQTTATWVTGVSGAWTDVLRWSTNPVFPNNGGGSTFNAVIATAGSPTPGTAYTVTLDQNIALSALDLTSADATLALTTNQMTISGNYSQARGTLTGSGFGGTSRLSFTGQGTIGSNGGTTAIMNVGALRNLGTLSFTGTGASDICDTCIDNSGVEALWAGDGALRFGGATDFLNRAGSVFRIQGSNTISRMAGPPGTPTITNLGTLIKDAGATTTITGVTLSNTGTVQVSAGLLSTDGVQLAGNTLSGGRWRALSGGGIDLQGQSVLTNAADVEIAGAGSTFAAFNAMQTNAAAGKITVGGGRDFTTAGAFTNNGVVTVGAGTVFAVAAGSSFTNYDAGTRTLSGGALAVSGRFRFDNVGVQRLGADVTLSGAASDLQTNGGASALASLSEISNGGKLTITSGRDFTTSGDFAVLTGGQLVVDTGQRFRVAAGSNLLNITGGVFNNAGFTVRGVLQADNADISTIGTSFTLDGVGAALQNGQGQNGLASLNTITNGGAFTIRGGNQLSLNAGLTLAGNLRVGGAGVLDGWSGGGAGGGGGEGRGAGTTLTVNGDLIQTGGDLRIDGGALIVTGTYQQQGGTLSGGGTLTAQARLGGTVTPGASTGGVGAITITGPATFTNTGRFAAEIGGVDFDTLAVMGALVFESSPGGPGATLALSMLPGAGGLFSVGQTLDILTYGARSGEFASVTGLTQGGVTFAVSYTDAGGGPGALRLTVVAVPAPGALACLVPAAGAWALRRRRR